jgi:hypothetical protein
MASEDDDLIIEIEVPSVLTLCISDRYNHDLAMGRTMFTPSVHTLHLERMDGPNFDSFMIRLRKQIAETRYPQLRSLHMFDINIDRLHMVDLVSATQGIKNLVLLSRKLVQQSVVFDFIRDYDSGLIASAGVLWPQLDAITTNSTNFRLLREGLGSNRCRVPCQEVDPSSEGSRL